MLPAAEIAGSVNDALTEHSAVVVTAPPGAGKSTLLPLTIMQGLGGRGKVLMLEPRRLAARQIAERMATVMGERVGQTVGYRVRFEKRVSDATQIEVLTEGILTRMLVDDATLDGVSVVIFDEFHERSLNSDLALALTLQSQAILRPDLKIVVMSATIDATAICHALDAPLIESRGRMYPVEIRYASDDYDRRDIATVVASAVRTAHESHSGDILVFMPGQSEIQRCAELLQGTLGATAIFMLYGNLPPEQQRAAIAPSRDGERKVVIATPIAETSLTIEGVRIVIDSGLCRQLVFDARTGMSHLETVRISMDMATQRMGRAGRIAEGVCYRLWTKASECRMAEQRRPEIADADLSAMLLDIAAFGESDIEALPWLTIPPRGNIIRARDLLVMLGAIDADGRITAIGKRMAKMPCHPRIARMLVMSDSNRDRRLTALACDVAAILEEKDPLGDGNDTDLSLRLTLLRRCRRQKQPGRWARIAQIAAEYRRLCRIDEDNRDMSPEEVGELVAYAYPERIARAMDHIGTYRLASGDNVRLDASDQMSSHQWLAVASLNASVSLSGQSQNGMGRIFLAAPVNIDTLTAIATERDNVSWDSKALKVTMQHEWRIGRLTVDSKPVNNAERSVVIGIICEAMKKDGLSMLSWNDEVQRLQRRVAAVAAWHPELGVPDLSTETLLQTAAEWLPLYLEGNGRLRTSAEELKKLNLEEMLWNSIPYDMQQTIDRLAPTHVRVPTGSRLRIDYRQGAEAPVLSVRLQECFGMEDTPCVDDGRQKVLMELLSPGFKPVQLTQDLRSFWQTTYYEVRKELRRRYPKHYWPEDPLQAEAVRGVKR